MPRSPSKPVLTGYKMTLKRTDNPFQGMSMTDDFKIEDHQDKMARMASMSCPADSRQPSPPRFTSVKPAARRKLARTDSPQSMDLGSLVRGDNL